MLKRVRASLQKAKDDRQAAALRRSLYPVPDDLRSAVSRHAEVEATTYDHVVDELRAAAYKMLGDRDQVGWTDEHYQELCDSVFRMRVLAPVSPPVLEFLGFRLAGERETFCTYFGELVIKARRDSQYPDTVTIRVGGGRPADALLRYVTFTEVLPQDGAHFVEEDAVFYFGEASEESRASLRETVHDAANLRSELPDYVNLTYLYEFHDTLRSWPDLLRAARRLYKREDFLG